MRAAFYERTGPAADVPQFADGPDPTPGPGEVRVRLAASGVNPSDVKARAGLRSKTLAFARIVPHSDGAGTIDAVGDGVPASRVGERVWVWNAAWGRPHGTAAGAVVLPSAQAVPLPDGVPFDAGACLGIPAMTALHALRCDGGVTGQRVLVAGGAGAVGHYAVQMARLLGARQVLATVSSEDKARIAAEAGAHATIDYKREDLAARVAELTGGVGVDRVIEVDAAANMAVDLALLRPGGRLVVYGSGVPTVEVPFVSAIIKGVAMRWFIVYELDPDEREAAQAQLTAWLERGALVHAVALQLPLAQIAAAHEAVEGGRVVGNVVLQID